MCARSFPDTSADKQEGETIRGELSCAPNSRNNRDLDIVIDWEVEGQEPSKGSMTYKMCV